jgi:hypothetical protein
VDKIVLVVGGSEWMHVRGGKTMGSGFIVDGVIVLKG